MTRPARFFLLAITPALALGLAALGWQTAAANPLGWFLVIAGIAFGAGIAGVDVIRGQRYWESALSGPVTQQEYGDRSFWLIAASLGAACFLPPIEYLHFPGLLSRAGWLPALGLILVGGGASLFIWARHTIGRAWAGHLVVQAGQVLVLTGPYRFIRHPGYAGYSLIALGIAVGYGSVAGLLVCLGLVLPSVVHRIRVEEQLLLAHFGDGYCAYARGVRRLLPGIW